MLVELNLGEVDTIPFLTGLENNSLLVPNDFGIPSQKMTFTSSNNSDPVQQQDFLLPRPHFNFITLLKLFSEKLPGSNLTKLQTEQPWV